MIPRLIVVGVVIIGWALVAKLLDRWRLSLPMLLIPAGAIYEVASDGSLVRSFNGHAAQQFTEIVLAILLFVDATEVRGGLLGSHAAASVRVLFIGLPLSIALAVAAGVFLVPSLSWAALLVLACTVMPTDFAPAPAMLRARLIPERVRHVLAVESGYGDGIASPLIIFALAVAGTGAKSDDHDITAGLDDAIPAALIAVGVGLVVGLAITIGMNRSALAGLLNRSSVRLILVLAPLVTYGIAVQLHGNGFIAAFVCGLTYRRLRRTDDVTAEVELADDVSQLLSAFMWFVFGSIVVYVAWSNLSWGLYVFALLSITLLRAVPVTLSMIGAGFSRREVAMIAWMGPRGTTSIVFGLLAFNSLADGPGTDILAAMGLAVATSVLVHGWGAGTLTARRARRIPVAETAG